MASARLPMDVALPAERWMRCLRPWMTAGALMAVVAALAFAVAVGDQFFSLVLFFAGATPDFREKPLFYVLQFHFHLPLFVLPVVMLRRRLTLPLFGLACGAAFWVNLHEIFDEDFHDWMLAMGLYPLAWRDLYGFVNPQYAKLVLYGLELTVLAPLMVWWTLARTWTIDRLVIVLATGVVCVTTFLFHVTLINGSYVEMRERRQAAIEAAHLLGPAGFEHYCAELGFECQTRPVDQLWAQTPDPRGRTLDHAEQIRRVHEELLGKYRANRAALSAAEAGQIYRHSWHASQILTDGIVVNTLYGYSLHGDHYRAVVDARTIGQLNDRHNHYFSGLCAIAHALWMYGGVYLIWWHHQRFRRQGAPGLAGAAR